MAVPNCSEEDSSAGTVEIIGREADPMVDSLVEAARYGDIDEVKEILAQYGPLLDRHDMHGRTALHMASANGHLDVLGYLLDRGADVNVQNDEKNTPLHWAALNGQVKVCEELIARGADASALNRYERTPLDEAMSRGKQDVVDAIITATAASSLATTTIDE